MYRSSFEEFDQLIPAAYSILIKPCQTVESNRWNVYEALARHVRDFTLTAGLVDTNDISAVKKFCIIGDDRTEAVRDLILKATGTIDLADPK